MNVCEWPVCGLSADDLRRKYGSDSDGLEEGLLHFANDYQLPLDEAKRKYPEYLERKQAENEWRQKRYKEMMQHRGPF